MKLLRGLLLAIVLAAVGCKRDPASPKPVTVHVIADAAQVEAARKAWSDDREQKLMELLKNPQNIRSYDDESIELVREHRERSVAALTRLRDDVSKPPAARIHAICALTFLDVPPSADQLAQLGRSNNEAAAALLFALQARDVYPKDQPLPETIKQFVVASIASSESRVRNAATHLATWRNISEAADVLLQNIRQQPTPDPALLKAAARLRPSAEILDALQRQLKPMGPFATSGTLGTIADLAEATKDPALQERAARICADYLKQQPNQPWIDGDSSAAVNAIGAVRPRETAERLLGDLIRSARWQLVRQAALQRLEELHAKAARQLARETGLKLAQENDKPANRQLTAQQIADLCTRHGVLTEAEARHALAQVASRTNRDEQTFESAKGFFYDAGRFLVFDVETGVVPNRHDLLLAQFAKASAGLFRPEAPLERYLDPNPKSEGGHWVQEGKGKYTVQFIHSNKLYRFDPNDLGDWYDVAAVATAIHRALEDGGIGERFVALESGGQDAQFIFGKPEAIERAAKDLGLVLGRDLDQARKSGKEFEEKALRNLKR